MRRLRVRLHGAFMRWWVRPPGMARWNSTPYRGENSTTSKEHPLT